jgi:hypothetical protein
LFEGRPFGEAATPWSVQVSMISMVAQGGIEAAARDFSSRAKTNYATEITAKIPVITPYICEIRAVKVLISRDNGT